MEIYGLFSRAAQALRVVDRSAMAINRFLNPEEEEEVEEPLIPEEVLAVVVDEVLGSPSASGNI
jgi:hypothetical protein